LTETDAEGHVTEYEYDLKGRKTKETDPNGGVTEYTYDDSDRLLTLKDPNGNVTSFAYDGSGNLAQETRPDGAKWTYTYDEDNNRKTMTDANGTVTTFLYDDADRLTGRTVQKAANVLGPASVTMSLDDLGRVASATTDEGVDEEFTYDSLDRQLSESVRLGAGPKRMLKRYYDPAGNMTETIFPSGLDLNYSIDPLNRIASITQAGSAIPIASYRDAGSRQVSKSLINGISETWSYDPNRRLTEILDTAASTTVRDVRYQRTPIGNKTAILRPDLQKKATYTFNPNSWITNESLGIPTDVPSGTPAVSTDYTIDKMLNYAAIRRNGVATTTSLNSRNQYTSFGGESLSYDKDGNLAGLHGSALAYDSEGHLEKATLPDGTAVENLYDPQGRKVEEKVTVGGVSKTTDYVLSGDQVAEEYVDGNLSARYVHGRGIDEIVRAEQSSLGNGTLDRTVFPIQDELGNVERLTDANGQTAERYEYEGYGKFTIFAPDGSGRSASAYAWGWLFQGRQYVPSLSTYDFRARTLWPELGRFGQEDPNPRSGQPSTLFAALGGSWTQYADPTGLYQTDFHYYAIYFLAKAQGYATGLAGDVAWASQYVDDSDFSGPVKNSVLNSITGSEPLHTMALHFLARGRGLVQRDNPEVRTLVRDAIKTGNPIRFGIALHTYADSFAHEGFTAYWDARNLRSGPYSVLAEAGAIAVQNPEPKLPGHLGTAEGGTANDRPYNDVAKAMEASRLIYDFMGQFAVRYYRYPPTPFPFARIERLLRSLFSMRGNLETRVEAWKRATTGVFGEEPDYSPAAKFAQRRLFDVFLLDQYRRALKVVGR
jgi:YD repeat-containing protein